MFHQSRFPLAMLLVAAGLTSGCGSWGQPRGLFDPPPASSPDFKPAPKPKKLQPSSPSDVLPNAGSMGLKRE